MKKISLVGGAVFLGLSLISISIQSLASTNHFKRAIIVVLENTDYKDAIKTNFMGKVLSQQCASFKNFHGEGHPSQGNYIAMTSGSTQGVSGDGRYDLDVQHIGNLLEAKGLSWKAYAEDYPGNCFTGSKSKRYVRKHMPFISYTNVTRDPNSCAKIVNSSQFDLDARNQALPEFSLYVPNLDNDGHDTGVMFADKWLQKTFAGYLSDPKFLEETLFVVTFDEDSGSRANTIFTLFCGSHVMPGKLVTEDYDHYDLLRTIEDEFGLGTLNLEDIRATPITDIWQ